MLKFRRFVSGVIDDAFTSFGIKLARSMPDSDIPLGRSIAVAFLGVQVQQFGTFHVFHLAQNTHQFFHIVAVKG